MYFAWNKKIFVLTRAAYVWPTSTAGLEHKASM